MHFNKSERCIVLGHYLTRLNAGISFLKSQTVMFEMHQPSDDICICKVVTPDKEIGILKVIELYSLLGAKLFGFPKFPNI